MTVRLKARNGHPKTLPEGNAASNGQDFFRSCFSHAAIGFSITDPSGRFLEVNPAYCTIMGYTKAELRELDILAITHPDDLTKSTANLQALVAGRIPAFVMEKRKIRKNGEVVFVENSVSLIRDADGRPLYLVRLTQDISDRERMHRALEESERTFQAFMNNLPAYAWIKDADGKYVYMNEPLQGVLPAHQADWKHRSDEDLWSAELADEYRRNDLQVLSEKQEFQVIENWLYEGQTRLLLVRKFPILDDHNPTMVGGTAIDITEHKLAEDRLKLSENQLAEAQHLAHMGSWNWDLQTNARTWSSELYHIFGFALDSAAPSYEESILQFVHPDDRELFQRSVEASLRDSKPCDVTFRIIRADKVERIIHGRGEVMKGDDGNAVRMFGTAQDITEQARSEQALIDAERHYRDIFENATEGIFQSTPEGQYIAANPALARMYGYESPEALIESCRDISHQIYADPERREEFKRLMGTEAVVREFEIKMLRKDGTSRWTEVNARAVRDPQGAVLYYEGTSQDITERKRAQEKSAAFATLARKLSGARTQLDAASIITEMAKDLFAWDACNVDLYDARLDSIVPLLNIDTIDGKQVDVTPLTGSEPPTAKGRRVIDGGPELQLRQEPVQFDPDTIPFGDTSRPSASLMTVPIQHGLEVVGLLSIQSYVPMAYDEVALKDFVSLADHCGEAINRIRAEQSLHESEERFRQLAEHLEDVVWIADRALTKVLYINRAYERVFGRSSQSVYESLDSFIDAVHPDDREMVDHMLERQRHGEYVPLEYRIIRPDGSIRWILRRAFPIRDNQGEIYRVAGVGQDITERKRVQEELRKSEETMRLFNLATNDMFWNWDFSTGNVVRSTGFERVFGYAELEIDPSISWWQNRLHPEDRQRVIDAVQSAVQRGEKACTYEYRFRRGDGSYATISDRAYIVRDELGNAVRAMGAMTDITERKEAEEALRESEERYRDLVENSRELICTHDLNGLVLSTNPAAAAALGYEPDEYVGKKTIRDILLPEVRHQFDEYMARLRKDGATSGIMLVETKSGETRMWEYYNSLRTEGVTAPVVRGMARDITEELRARKALRQSEERYRELFENSRDAIYLHDMDGRYLSVNRAAEELTGYSRDEILGRDFTGFVAPRSVPSVRRNFCKKLEKKGATMYEVEVITKDGRPVPVEVSSRMIYNDAVPVGVQGTVRNISERKRSQEMLRAYSRRLVEAQEMERKKIARELHDEIGQILTAVRLGLHAVKRTSETSASLSQIDETVVIVDEALERVREMSLELRPAMLDDLGLVAALRWYLNRFCERAGIGGRVHADFGDEFRLPHKLEIACFRIVQEALTNVARHADASVVDIAMKRSNHELRLRVVDDGKGFDVDKLLASFSSKSFGLHGIEERAFDVGGEIEIRSSPGEGTELCATFPLSQRTKPRRKTV